MTLIKPVALLVAILVGILLAGVLIVLVPILIPEARPFYARAYRSARQQLPGRRRIAR